MVSSPVLDAIARNGGKVEKNLADIEHPNGVRVTVSNATPEEPWSAQVSARATQGSVKKGDRLLVCYDARRRDGPHGSAVAKIQMPAPPYTMAGMTKAAAFGGKWERVNQAMIAQCDLPVAEVVLFLGEQIQTVEITNLRLINYGPDFDMAKLPGLKESYEGREPDAAWRKEALARIDKIRMADMAVRFVDALGEPIANKSMTVELDHHEFGFGSCVTRKMLMDDGPDGQQYRNIIKRTFSRVVFENDLKPGLFPDQVKGREELDKSIAWLAANGISIRGHYLMQDAVDPWTRKGLSDPAQLKEVLLSSVRERINYLGNRVVEWDAINHPIGWQGAEMLGKKAPPFDSLGMDVFQMARSLTKLPLCINEDQLFRPGPQQDGTFELLSKLKELGVLVDGLGNQAHFHSSFLPAPEYLLKVTDRFATVVPKQVITELDIVTNGDDLLAADYLRDCMIAIFSHSAYDGLILWGFWEGAHWRPEAALWRKDWSSKPAARVWEDWIGNHWHTQLTLKTDPNGIAVWRGFKGSYRANIDGNDTSPFLPGASGSPLSVRIP